MSVAAGNLDALVGISGNLGEFQGVNVKSYSASGQSPYDIVATLAATIDTTNNLGIPAAADATFRIASVDDSVNSITLALLIGSAVTFQNEYVIGYTASSILLSSKNSNTVAQHLDALANVDSTLDVFSIQPIPAGTAVTFAANGTYTGPSATQIVSTVTSAGSAPSPVTGADNTEIISGAPAGSVIEVTPGYQAASIAGATPLTLLDTSGNTLLTAGSGNVTLMSAASFDTLQAGAGNDVLVSFSGPAVETAAGQDGDNLFFGGASPVTVQGGAGHDTAIMSSGGAITTGGGGSQVWLNVGATAIQSNGADTIVAGGAGSATVSVTGGNGVLAFGGDAALVFQGGTGVSTVVGVSGSASISGGSGGGLFYGGSSGHNMLLSGSGPVTMTGGGTGDVLVATGGANDVLQASAGVETLNAVASSGSDAFFGGSGSDCIIGGSGANVFTAGPGNMTLIGGGARDLYVFLDGATSTTVIADFNPTHDYIRLSGFPSGAAQTALQGATASGGNTTMTLGDGTKVTFDGLAPGALSKGNFA